MTFTDANPTFPYQSSEAKRQLGIPDSPEIHLAITRLAERLVPLAEGESVSESNVRITALRVASGGVLFSYPFEYVVIRFRAYLGLPIEEGAIDKVAKLPGTDWLGQAVQDLRNEGVEIPPKFPKQVSNYGWSNVP
jgi:hypothetical protein